MVIVGIHNEKHIAAVTDRKTNISFTNTASSDKENFNRKRIFLSANANLTASVVL